MKELSIFKLISTFRRKASIKVNIEEKRLVEIDNKRLLNNKDIDKSIKTKK